MTGIVILILRILLAACLYGFLGWAFYTIWRELHLESQMAGAPTIPALAIKLFENEPAQTFTTPEVIIGRSENCEFPIPDETVSARHARLSYHQNQWWVEDMGSTNGTFLNDERVRVPTVIISGDELRCGQVSLVLSISDKTPRL